SYVEGDVALARAWYGARGGYRECLLYPSNLFKEVPPGGGRDGLLNVQVGNSADPGNGHFEMLELLAASPRAGGMRIYAPLSYGDPAHARAVAERGQALFGDRFVAMLDFMPLPAYVAWLGSIDIALFNHQRQQGMGNAITLLGMGKKVHLRTDVSQWEMFRRLGLAVFPLDAFVPERLSPQEAARNREIVRREFSEERLQEQLSRIFEE
ncbi:MAG TPA: TDP-N-acetylfucosamine:lipid II N-acetylfucosaminyltransferase, partial [Ramlibacter sp.]